MFGAVTPRHGGCRTEKPVTIETEPPRGSRRQYRTNPLGQPETRGRQQPPADESGLGQGDRRRVCSGGAQQLDGISNATPGSTQLFWDGDVTEAALLQRVP